MTWGELKNQFKDIPDNTDVAILLSDGELDFAVDTWIDDEGVMVVTGN